LALIKYNSTLHINGIILINEKIPVNDPKDWYIHNLALQNNVSIITADKHFLLLENPVYPVIPISDFLKNV
jgi:predicted nucleic acid-binding protein